MDSHGFMFNLVIYLSAAVVAVPLFARLGLGSVLGYLFAGICIGPWGLGLIGNVSDILHFSELGVVLLLFLIGLELAPRKLWRLRRPILGLGGLQVCITAAFIAGIAFAFGIRWQTAVVAGLGLALSSTAIALQIIKEKDLMNSPAGRIGFSVLLFQDLAVIPIIALIPLLGMEIIMHPDAGEAPESPGTLIIVAAIAAIYLFGKYALRHIFHFVAGTHLREIFTALSLLLVAGIIAIMDALGISAALGAFLAGVLLADSEYRHTLESDIEPFKGLLLGLFFISVGMSIDFGLLLNDPLRLLLIAVALVALKAAVLYGIARRAGIPPGQRWLFTFTLSQGGEFAFVLFGFAVTAGAMPAALSNQLILAVTLSMVATPLLLIANDKLIAPRFAAGVGDDDDAHSAAEMAHEQNPVIIIGFGRFGQVVGRLLMANKITPTLIDNNPEQLERVRKFGYKTYYGDAARLDVLRSAGAAQAKLIVLAMADAEVMTQSIALIRREFPDLKIFARAFDRGHAMQLIDSEVDGFARETFSAALELGEDILQEFGFDSVQAHKVGEKFRQFDMDTLHSQVEHRHDEKALISIAQSARENMEETFAADFGEESGEGKATE